MGWAVVQSLKENERDVCLVWLMLACSVVGGRDEGQEKGTVCRLQRQAHD